jgi:hypothetical protein
MKIAVLYSSDTQAGILKGLTSLGHEVVPMYYGLEVPLLLDRLIYRTAKGRLKKIVNNFNSQINGIKKMSGAVDLLLIMKGHFLTSANKTFLKSLRIPKIQWTIDSIDRFPGQADVAPYMDKVFVQDGVDEKNGSAGKWLPLGFDDEVFRYKEQKDIDVLLMGRLTLPFYNNRLEYIRQASKLGKDGFKVVFAGSNLQKEDQKILEENQVQIHISPKIQAYADIISRSRICVNIHQEDGGKPVNPMFFAIPATGGLQLTEEREYLSRWLNQGELFFPEKLENVPARLVEILQNKCAFVSEEAARNVTKKHSFTARASEILL